MDAAERALLESTVAEAFAGGGALDGVLADLGWLEMLATEPDAAVAIVGTALGRVNGTASILDDVVVAALGLEPRADLATLLPAFGGTIGTARVASASELCIGGTIVPIGAAAVTPIGGIDPEGGWHTVRVDATTDLDTNAVAWGRRAVGHQIAGASRAMLDLACDHARERVQFGRPIARFQAVRHRLAESLVAIEALDAALAAAADEPNPTTAALAKALAGRTARTVGAHCQQVLAGIGFTTEHPFHTYLKRTMFLDGVFGAADDIVVDLGRELLSSRTVPTLIEL